MKAGARRLSLTLRPDLATLLDHATREFNQNGGDLDPMRRHQVALLALEHALNCVARTGYLSRDPRHVVLAWRNASPEEVAADEIVAVMNRSPE